MGACGSFALLSHLKQLAESTFHHWPCCLTLRKSGYTIYAWPIVFCHFSLPTHLAIHHTTMSDRQSTPVTDFEDDPQTPEDITPVNHYVVLSSRQETAFYSDKTLDQIISIESHRRLIRGLAQTRERRLPEGTEARIMDSLIGAVESAEIWDFVDPTQWGKVLEDLEQGEKEVYTEISWNDLVSAAKVTVPNGRDKQADEPSANNVASHRSGDNIGIITELSEEILSTAKDTSPLATSPEVSLVPDIADSVLCGNTESHVREDGPQFPIADTCPGKEVEMKDAPSAMSVAYSCPGYGTAMEIDDPDQSVWQIKDTEMTY